VSGWSTAGANSALDGLVGTFIQAHVGDPGAAGTSNNASVTTRLSLTWGASSNGTKAITNQPAWANWAGTTQTITHVSQWTASSGGTFKGSAPLSTPVLISAGATLTITAYQLTFGPVAA
jgi:hypothetical protein